MHLPERPLRCAPAAVAGNVLTLAALLLLPLYMPSGYVGLVDAKFHLLLWLAGAGAALLVWRLWLGLRGRAPAVRLDLATALPLPVLCLSYTVAWFFAEDRALALWGLAGRLARLLFAGGAWALCAAAAGLLARWLPIRTEWRTLSGLVTQLFPALAVAGVFFALGALLRRWPTARSWRAARVLGVLTVLLAAELFAAANFTSILPESLAASLRFDDQWGSNRGFAWKRLWTVYKDDLTPLQMVFGLGGDAANARLNIDDYSVKYMTLLNGDVFDSAHNEYLQHLLCGGAVGLAAWLAFLAGHIRRGLRTAPGLALAVFGYAVQAFFSISMPGVLPLVFVLAALCVKPQPLAARGEYRCLLGLALAAPPVMLLAAL